MKYIVTHTTRYRYQESVSHCYNVAYLLPRTTAQQTLLHSRIDTTPHAATYQTRSDYFGNQVVQFSIDQEHRELDVTVTSTLSITPGTINHLLDFGNTCAVVHERLQANDDHETLLATEFRLPSPMVPLSAEVITYAADCFQPDKPFLQAVMDLTGNIFSEFSYDAHFSDVATPIATVIKHKRGVCQDFAHVAIACLRAQGYAARYVSGYLETLPPPGQQKLIGADASHAWFSVFVPGEGWFDFDPTNNSRVSDRHITTAWGRDYSDVAPLKGIIFGGGNSHSLDVSVDVQEVAE